MSPSPLALYQNFITDLNELIEPTDFSISTWLAFGAAFQLLSQAYLPPNLAFWLPLLWLGYRAFRSGVDCTRIGKGRGVFDDVIVGRRSAVLGEEGRVQGGGEKEYGYGDANRNGNGEVKGMAGRTDDGIVAFLLGARINHPLGKLAPGCAEIDRAFKDMWLEAETNRKKWTYLGRTPTLFDISDREGITTFWVSYWKDLKALQEFATSAAHRLGQNSYYAKKYPYVGIMHETYHSPRGSWETIYDNCPPLGLGRAKYIVGEDENGLVLADTLKDDARSSTMYKRMGRAKVVL